MKISLRTVACFSTLLICLSAIGCRDTTAQSNDGSTNASHDKTVHNPAKLTNITDIGALTSHEWSRLREPQKRAAIDAVRARNEALFARVRADYLLWSQALDADGHARGLGKAQRDARFFNITQAITGQDEDALDLTASEGREEANERIKQLRQADRAWAQNALLIFTMGQNRAAAQSAIDRAQNWGAVNEHSRPTELHGAIANLIDAEATIHQATLPHSNEAMR